MPRRTSYAPGTPSWVDLGTSDLEVASSFYCSLFGWEAHVAPQPEAGGYTMFTKDGANVAGMGPLMSDEQPPAWSTYVTVIDADATAAAAVEAGAKLVVEPMTVLDVGRMAVLIDPTGAAISIWQPMAHHGADLVNEPGCLCWNELTTRDPVTAAGFYDAVFGWHAHNVAFETPEGTGNYTDWKLDPDSEPIGGMMPMEGDEWPADLPSHWMVYFAVDDPDATAARCAELGGTVSVPPTDIPPGRFAVLGDPTGAYFSIIAMSDPSPG